MSSRASHSPGIGSQSWRLQLFSAPLHRRKIPTRSPSVCMEWHLPASAILSREVGGPSESIFRIQERKTATHELLLSIPPNQIFSMHAILLFPESL